MKTKLSTTKPMEDLLGLDATKMAGEKRPHRTDGELSDLSVFVGSKMNGQYISVQHRVEEQLRHVVVFWCYGKKEVQDSTVFSFVLEVERESFWSNASFVMKDWYPWTGL